MNEHRDSGKEPPKHAPEEDKQDAEDKTYVYRTAGIQEREGRVPSWLLLVIVGLLVWGVYYLIQYWHPPS